MTKNSEFFNLADKDAGIKRNLAAGADARIFVGEHSMLSIVEFEPNAEGSIHSHAEEQWGVLLEGDGIRTQDGVDHAVRQGDFWRTPGDVLHGFRAGSRGAKILDIFSPPRAAYRKAGAGFSA